MQPKKSQGIKIPSWLTRNVLAIGLVSLFTDISGEMVVSLLPLFITTVLGGGAMAVAWVDGLAELSNAVLQVFAGRRADRTGKKRPLVLLGYSLSGLVRPLMAFASVPWHAVAVRVTDRIGKGLRSSPRDAMLAAESSDHERGRVYGFHRAMDHTGAVLGPLIAVGLLSYFSGDLRKIFMVAAIPGIAAVLVILFLLKEKVAPPVKASIPAWSWIPQRELWPALIPIAVFTLGASSDMFLLLKAARSNAPIASLPLLWMALHVVKVSSSLLGGQIADRMGARASITLGWTVYIAIYVGLAYVEDPTQVAALFIIYGLFHGLTEGPEKALIARLAPVKTRATAFGWYNLTTGVLSLPASLFFGWLWDTYGPATAFYSGAFFAACALLLLLVFKPGGVAHLRIGKI